MAPLFKNPNEDSLELFLMEIFVILLLTRIVSKLLRWLQQPAVIAEIIAGIMLGPSCFGYIPGFSTYLFPASSASILSVIANVALILFMFFLGLEVEPAAMAATWKTSVPLAVAGLLVPWISGGILSFWLFPLEHVHCTSVVFFLFTGTAFSFTAMPVLGRILTARKLIHTPLGVETLSIAAVDDLLAWTTLAIVLAYANGGAINGIYIILIAIGFILFLVFPVRRLNLFLMERLKAKGKEESRVFTGYILLSLCVSSFFADVIGIHFLFGAFVYGMTVPRGPFVDFIAPKIELLVVEFFLPLYFANSGIRTSLGSLSGTDWGIAIIVLVIATVSKLFPIAIGSYLANKCKVDWRYCLSVGFLINTRGLIALIVLNIGLTAGIFGVKVFTMMVFMALITTFMTSPAIHLLNKGKKLENSKAEQQVAYEEGNIQSDDTLNAVSGEELQKQLAQVSQQASVINAVIDDDEDRTLSVRPKRMSLSQRKGSQISVDHDGRILASPTRKQSARNEVRPEERELDTRLTVVDEVQQNQENHSHQEQHEQDNVA